MKNTYGMTMKILSIFESGLFIKIVSGFVTSLWIAGLILGNIFIIALAIVLLMALGVVLYLHKDNLKEIFQGNSDVIVEDERTQLINEKAATMTLGIFVAVIIWVAIIIMALRGTYPQYLPVSYTLFASGIFCFVLYFGSRAYYGRKY
jgi:uncharacterized membrane protein